MKMLHIDTFTAESLWGIRSLLRFTGQAFNGAIVPDLTGRAEDTEI